MEERCIPNEKVAETIEYGMMSWVISVLTTAILNDLNLLTVQYVCLHVCACVSPNVISHVVNVVNSLPPV